MTTSPGMQHAQVAVDGFGGMQKKGRRAGGAECGGDLLGDDAALAHAGDHDAAIFLAAAEDQLDGAGEGFGHGAFKARWRGLRARRLRCGPVRPAADSFYQDCRVDSLTVSSAFDGNSFQMAVRAPAVRPIAFGGLARTIMSEVNSP